MENPSFSINDLLFMKNLVEVINRRGGFQPNELVPVGEFYNRISAFYDFSVKQLQDQQPQEAQPASEEAVVSKPTTGNKPKEK